ncbi:MAG: hypothetical protein K0V04_38375, partial [Deltaproteobacteria bacterium]|nr:hypothetical protein [Deltaproteobacteria bacterium]
MRSRSAPFSLVMLLLGACAGADELDMPGLLWVGDPDGSTGGPSSASGDATGVDSTGLGEGSEDATGEPDDPGPDSGLMPVSLGCADGQREGFVDPVHHPGIAACAGGWTEPGLVPVPPPTCQRLGGDDTVNPGGAGCSAADLCAEGWHVCETAIEVAARTNQGCADMVAPGFFAIAQSGPGNAQCGEGLNDLFGCGTLGSPLDSASCNPLDHFSGPGCEDLPSTWNCGLDGDTEASHVAKPTAE